MQSEKEKLTDIINLGVEIAQFKDVDLVLERILTLARRFTNAEAGSIYEREGDRLRFTHAQNTLLEKKLQPGRKLIYETCSIPINNESLAGYAACCGETLNIRDVYRLPSTAPFSFDKDYDRISKYRTRSVLTFPLKTPRGNIIGVLQLINAKDDRDRVQRFSKEDEPLIKHFANNAAIALERARMTRAIILRVIKMAELRDPKETGAHVNRVASYAAEIYDAWASRRALAREEIERNKDIIRIGAMLHDVGKIAVSDLILKKPATLDRDEYEIMKRHTEEGAKLFSEKFSDFDDAASVIALTHHERWDGTGYPGGRKGEEIPLFGRVVAVADVYDALCSKRSYKNSWDQTKVLETIKSGAGLQFDPEVVDAFFSVVDVIQSMSKRYPDE